LSVSLKILLNSIKDTEDLIIERFDSLQRSKVVVMAERDKLEITIRKMSEKLKKNSYWFGLSEYLQGRLDRLRNYSRSVFRWNHNHVKNCVHSTEGETLFDFLIKLKYYLKSEKIHSNEHRGSDGIIYIRDGNSKRYAITIKEAPAY
jgi:hypothetical protein